MRVLRSLQRHLRSNMFFPCSSDPWSFFCHSMEGRFIETLLCPHYDLTVLLFLMQAAEASSSDSESDSGSESESDSGTDSER
jgi:hypothetical protein